MLRRPRVIQLPLLGLSVWNLKSDDLEDEILERVASNPSEPAEALFNSLRFGDLLEHSMRERV